ncbi:MAG TPA: zf-HC2 domain-containing protein [Gaiellaceae bacterium]|jgi:anti-sigma factor RsiW
MFTPVPPSACQRAREAVSARLDGELSELGSARLAAHLRECDACAAYALEVSAISTRLRMAPLEQPGVSVALPGRRRRPGLQIAAAAAAVLVAAASSLALGHSLRSSKAPARTATRAVTAPTLQQDIVSQHILAMERKLPVATTLRVGPVLAL